MLCQSCQNKEANVHIRETINGNTTEKFLCQTCADAGGELQKMNHAFSFPQFLTGMLDDLATSSAIPKKKRVECPACQLTMNRFLKTGKFGCSECYKTFQQSLPQIIKQFQGGYVQHQGKHAVGLPPVEAVVAQTENLQNPSPIEKLKAELQQAITVEDFEKAAELRDQIKAMDAKGGEGA